MRLIREQDINTSSHRLVLRSWMNGSQASSLLLLSLLVAMAGVVSCVEQQREEPVVAIVNGQTITQTEFDLRWGELSHATRARYEKEGGKRRFLDELITRELLMQEAQRRRLDQDDMIRDKTRRYKEQLILDELFKDKLQTKVEVTQAELDAYYANHAGELLDPLKVNVSVMLLPNVYAAKDLEAQINRGGSFVKFAQRYSIDDKSKSKGGDIGPYRKGLLPPEVDTVIHTLKPGMVSAPIKSEDGYYLVLVTPLDEAVLQADLATQERLRQELLAEKRRKRFEEVIVDIRTNATVRFAESSRYLNQETSKR